MGYALLLISFSKTATEMALDSSEILILLCGFVLAIGAAGEYIEEHGTLPKWMKWSQQPKMVFVWMVALSLVGEFVGDACVFKFSGQLQTINDGEVAALNKEAGEANRLAGAARKEAADATGRAASVGIDLEHERQKTARFQKEADEARLSLLKQIREQGPRAKLLTEAAQKLTIELAPFAGRRVGLYVCGQQGITEQETLDTWGAIANILGSDTVAGVTGAKWKEVPTNLNWAANCGAAKGLGQGVIVFVSKRASKNTTDAATVLAEGLTKALPPSPNKILGIQDPDFVKLTIDRGFQGRDSPWAAAALDSELITVLIGEHP